jgi:flagellar L-ring protein precursor FlgH
MLRAFSGEAFSSRKLGSLGLILCGLLLSACTPTTVTQGPLTTRPSYPSSLPAANGAIYNTAAYRPLFEDRRARFIGDILTINITENTSATKANGSSASKNGSVDSGVATSFGSPITRATFQAESANSYADKAAANSSNAFTGAISVTVTDVLPNGYLVVGGEKQIALDKGAEFVRFSGVVNPDTIALGNVVPSSKVADARMEYRTNSRLDATQITSILARFFLSFIPL